MFGFMCLGFGFGFPVSRISLGLWGILGFPVLFTRAIMVAYRRTAQPLQFKAVSGRFLCQPQTPDLLSSPKLSFLFFILLKERTRTLLYSSF